MEAALILCTFLIKEKGRNEIPFGKCLHSTKSMEVIMRYHAAV